MIVDERARSLPLNTLRRFLALGSLNDILPVVAARIGAPAGPALTATVDCMISQCCSAPASNVEDSLSLEANQY